MTVCPYCGKENNQPDAAYCLYCGSSLKQQGVSSSSPSIASSQGYGMSGGGSSPELSERYQRVLTTVEQLGTVVAVLAVVTLIMVLL